MIRLKLLILFFLIGSFGFTQETYLDTLKANLETEENKKAYLYKLLSSEKKDYRLAVISNAIGLQFQRENNLDSAFYCHKQALKYALKVSAKNQEIGVSYNKIGIIYYYRGKLDSAIVFFKKSIPYYHDKSLKANSLNNLAVMHKYNSSPDVAIDNYLLAYDIYKELKDSVKQVYVLNNIGALYNDLFSFDKAKEYLNKGVVIAQLSKNKDGEMNCKGNLGKTFTDIKNYEKAIPLLKQCISYYKRIEDYQFLIINKNNLANCYDELGEKNRALKVYKEIIDLMESTGLENNKEAILINIGTSYQEQGKFNTALEYIYKALEFSKNNSIILRYEPIYKSLSSIYQSMNNIDSSLYYKNLQIALRDSLDNVEREKKMMELEAKHQNKELNTNLKLKQSELDETERKRSLISKSFVISLLIILITVFGVVIFYNRYRKKKILSENLSSTIHAKNEEIENLSQIKEKGKLPYPKDLDVLTEREQEVLIGVQEGLKDQEIADKLFISITTVRTHLRKAYSKIGVRNRAEAIQFISKYDI